MWNKGKDLLLKKNEQCREDYQQILSRTDTSPSPGQGLQEDESGEGLPGSNRHKHREGLWASSQPADTLHVQMESQPAWANPLLPTHAPYTAGHQSVTYFNSWEQVSLTHSVTTTSVSSAARSWLSCVNTDSLSCFNLKEKSERAQEIRVATLCDLARGESELCWVSRPDPSGLRRRSHSHPYSHSPDHHPHPGPQCTKVRGELWVQLVQRAKARESEAAEGSLLQPRCPMHSRDETHLSSSARRLSSSFRSLSWVTSSVAMCLRMPVVVAVNSSSIAALETLDRAKWILF